MAFSCNWFELVTTLDADVTPTRNMDITQISLRLLRHNTTTGTLSIQVRDSNSKIIASSSSVTISAMASLSYAVVDTPFPISVKLQKDLNYKIRLVPAGGYSFSSNNHIGWLQDTDYETDSERRVAITYANGRGFSGPFDYLPFEKRLVVRG